MSDAVSLFSILLLLKLDEAENFERGLRLTAALGLLSGLAIVTRFTDGVALCLSTALAIGYLVRARRSAYLIAFFCVVSVVIVGIVASTGDSLRDYATSTILHAAGPKGGLAHVLARPLSLLSNSIAFLGARKQLMTVFYCAAAASSWTWLIAPFSRADRPRSTLKAAVGLALLTGAVVMLWPVIQNGDLIVTLSAVWVITAYGCVFFVVCRVVL